MEQEPRPTLLADVPTYFYGRDTESLEEKARCRVRIWDGEQTVVVYSEDAENPGMSVTNAAEVIATGVVADFNLDPQRTRWIEHYPEKYFEVYGQKHKAQETFAEVLFYWNFRKRAYAPHWVHITKEEVERLVGELE